MVPFWDLEASLLIFCVYPRILGERRYRHRNETYHILFLVLLKMKVTDPSPQGLSPKEGYRINLGSICILPNNALVKVRCNTMVYGQSRPNVLSVLVLYSLAT